MAEYNGLRAKMYEEAIVEFPNARLQDIAVMQEHLNPKEGEHILGVGEGNGFFVPHIVNRLGANGQCTVVDPSSDQLHNLEKRFQSQNVQTICIGIDEYQTKEQFDKAWSFGAFHHCPNQEQGMRNIYDALKPNSLLVLCDVWRNTALSEHFDGPVAKYCCTGHDVKFLGDTYAKTITQKAGFKDIHIEGLPIKWLFDSEFDIGKFIYKLHAMTQMQGSEDEKIAVVLEGCKDILGVEHVAENQYALN